MEKYITEYAFFADVIEELKKAREKFPTNDGVFVNLAALTEEVGELNQAILQYTYEPHKAKTTGDIRKEAAQVVTMVLRVLFDDNPFPHHQR